MARRRVFAEVSPLGHRVVLTRDRWREIVRFKHPALADRDGEVRDCIRASVKDPDAHLYYKSSGEGYLCAVVGGEDPQNRFVVTVYHTDKLKKGLDLWTK